MEVWVDLRQDETPVITQGVDRWLVNKPLKQQEVAIEQDVLTDSDGLLGGYYLIADGESQNKCKAAIGSADWVLVECQTWSMIPLENLIAAKQGSPTKIAASSPPVPALISTKASLESEAQHRQGCPARPTMWALLVPELFSICCVYV